MGDTSRYQGGTAGVIGQGQRSTFIKTPKEYMDYTLNVLALERIGNSEN